MRQAISPEALMPAAGGCGSLTDQAIGSLAGSATYDACAGDTLAISANGVPSSTADVQYVVQREVCGDGEAIVRVLSVSGGLAGLELRESNAAGSVKAGLKTVLSTVVQRYSRTQTDAAQSTNNLTALGHKWLRLVRSGNTVTTYVSSTGSNWTQAASYTFSNLPSCVYVGLLMQSTNTNTTHTGVFDNLVYNDFTAASGPPTTFSFAQDSISAQPGDTVQICVNITDPCACAPASVEVDIEATRFPYFAAYTPQSLTFNGSSQQCFGVVVGQGSGFERYRFKFRNAAGGNGATFDTDERLHVFIQGDTVMPTGLACGVYDKKDSLQLDSLSPDLGFAFVDRFGNVFLREELSPQGANMVCADAGHFVLESPDPGSISAEEIETICAAFQDVSASLSSAHSAIPIRIIFTSGTGNLGGANVSAASSSVYRYDLQLNGCGVENNLIWEMMNTNMDYGIDQYPFDYVAGYIIYNSDLSWHTLADDGPGGFSNPAINPSEQDLYSVTIHELLHLLGISSRIRTNGAATNQIYSRWDEFLYRGPDSNQDIPLLVSAADPVCCDQKTYNPALPPPNPNEDGNCTENYYYFGSDRLATVRATYANGAFLSDDALLANKLAHLDGACDGQNYVMNALLASGVHRRVITETELQILCRLGYERTDNQQTNCQEQCVVIAAADGVYSTFGSDIMLNIENQLLNNDVYPVGDFEIVLDNCGDNSLSVVDNADGTYTISGLQPGQEHRICYTISGCSDSQCDQAVVYIYRMLDTPLLYPEAASCNTGGNLFSLGDFEAFIIEPGNVINGIPRAFYYQQLDVEVCNPFDPAGLNGNTVDVLLVEGNQVGAIAGIRDPLLIRQNIESMFIPLSAPIKPGCTAEISFRYRLAPFQGIQPSGNIQIFATSGQPCLTDGDPNCFDPVSSMGWYCVNSGITVNNMNWQTTSPSIEWINDTGEPVNYFILVNNVLQSPAPRHVIVDDIVITEQCNELSLSPLSFDICPETNEVSVAFDVCVTGDFTPVGGIDLDVLGSVLDNPLVSIANAGSFLNGEASLSDLEAGGDCASLTLVLDVSGIALENEDNLSVSIEIAGTTICTESAVLSIAVSDNEPDASISVDDDGCGNVSFVVQGLQAGEEIVSIDYGDGQLGSALDHTYEASGTYAAQILIENSCGTVFTFPVSFGIEIEPAPAPAFTYAASCGEVTFEVEGGLPQGATIDYGDEEEGESLVHNYPEGGSFTATLQIPYTCGTATIQLLVITPECFDCEDCITSNTIGSSGNTTNISAAGAIPTGAERCVEGTLVIDQNTTLTNCHFRMGAGAAIIVNEGFSLNLNNSTLEGCGILWRGIVVENGATLNIGGGDDALIADAALGVHLLSGSQASSLSINKARFERNFVAVYKGAGVSPLSFIFAGVSIDGGADGLAPAYTGMNILIQAALLPAYNAKSWAGVWLQDVSTPLTFTVNKFLNSSVGLYVRNASFTASQNEFINIVNTHSVSILSYLNPIKGCAVFGRGNAGQSLSVIRNPVFSNCQTGVRLEGGGMMQVVSNNMSEVTNGILLRNINTGGGVISDNDIEYARKGILLIHSEPGSALRVFNNIVQLNPVGSSDDDLGIALSSVTPSMPGISAAAEVFSNSITLYKGLGIWLEDCQGVKVMNNTDINLMTTAARAGIWIEGGGRCEITDNKVTGAGTALPPGGTDNTANMGINIINSPGNAYCCNIIEDTHVGIRVEGASASEDRLRGNTFHASDKSLYLPDGIAFIGTQEHTQNCWESGSGPAAYGVDEQFAQQYPFIVDNFETNCFLPIAVSPTEWFRSETDSEQMPDCGSLSCNVANFKPDSPDTKRIAAGATELANYPEALLWGLQRHIFGHLKSNATQDSLVLSFMAQSDSNEIGAFQQIQEDWAAAFAIDSTDQKQIGAWLTAASVMTDSASAQESLWLQADSSSAAGLLLARAQYLLEADSLGVLADTLASAVAARRMAALTSLRADNGGIGTALDYMTNEKEVNDVHLAYYAKYESDPDSADLIGLNGIANQCPLLGGHAVYRARALLTVLTGERANYPDSLNCAQGQAFVVPYPSSGYVDEAPIERVLIYPNPASDQIHLSWAIPVIQGGTFRVTDLLGRLMLQVKIQPDQARHVLPVSSLQNGLYWFQIELDGVRYLQQVMINR